MIARDQDVQIEPDYRIAGPLSGQTDTRRTLISGLTLTSREYEILVLLADGLADKEIAEIACISRFTVNKHVGSLLLKLDAASRTHAAVKALKLGLID